MRKYLPALGLPLFVMLAVPASAEEATCARAALSQAAEAYVEAQLAGDPERMALAETLTYREQMAPASLRDGILARPLVIAFHRTLLDPQTCQGFIEAVVTDPAHPYVLGTRLKLSGGKVTEIETLITDSDDWLFNAGNTMRYSQAEHWDVVSPEDRASRDALIAAANAYLDHFADKSIPVPWGQPCARLEGGLYTTRRAPGVVTQDDSCNVGVPENTHLVDRRYIVDEDMNAVVVLLAFGKNRQPDSHMFRVENGKLRYVHTITVCRTPNCGFPPHPVADAPAT